MSSIEEITEDSLKLFTVLEPKLDIIVLGYGDQQKDLNFYRNLVPFSKRNRLTFEILPTEQACATFNFLTSEGRYVAGALIPPHNIAPTDDDVLQSKMRYQNLYDRRHE